MSRHKLGSGFLASALAREIRRLKPSSVFAIVDPGAKAITESALQNLPCVVMRGTRGERLKTPEAAAQLTQKMVRKGLDRQSLVIAVGGGASTDLTGFAAATALRGVRWGVVSTTLLSMADAGLGGKTAVNLPEGKNLMGAFHMPEFVFADLATLETLPSTEWTSGLGEILKAAMLSGTAALSRLEVTQASDFSPEILSRIQGGSGSDKSALLQILQMSVRVKKKIVGLDPLESGLRKTLNLGHTFGHAVETATAQQTASKRLSHGSAVALGLICALRFAVETGLAAPTYYDRILALAEHLGLPTQFQGRLPAPNEIRRLLKHDKKALGGKLDLILPTRPGAVEIVKGIRVGQVERVLRRELG